MVRLLIPCNVSLRLKVRGISKQGGIISSCKVSPKFRIPYNSTCVWTLTAEQLQTCHHTQWNITTRVVATTTSMI